MFQKKAQGLSLNTIIIAAIALVVLIVIIAIFSGRISIFSGSYDETTESASNKVCSNQGGTCMLLTQNCPSGAVGSPDSGGKWIDCGPTQKCCKSY